MVVGSVICRSSGDDGILESAAGKTILTIQINIRPPIFLNGNCITSPLPINLAALHYENGILEQRDIFCGIAIDGDDVRELARIKRADPV